MGRLRVAVAGQRLRGRPPQWAPQWLPDTPSKRPRTGVWGRRLVAAQGTAFTWQDIASMVGRPKRQAARQPRADWRQCGADWRAVVLRQRQVDAPGVAAGVAAWRHPPWAGPTALGSRVQTRVDRHDLRMAPSARALAPLSGVPVRRRRQWETGQGP